MAMAMAMAMLSTNQQTDLPLFVSSFDKGLTINESE